MTQSVRYQKGQLYPEHGAWFVRYRERRRQKDASIKLERRSKRLGSVEKYPTKSSIEPVRTAFMQKANAGQVFAEECMTLVEFLDAFYLPRVQTELRASTLRGYRHIWKSYLVDRIGKIRLHSGPYTPAGCLARSLASAV